MSSRASCQSLDIVIVNWNTGRQLVDCLVSIAAAHRDRIELRSVVIVDNASWDESLPLANALVGGIENLPVRIICNPSNRGFGAACNQGAAVGNGEYILFLNPDTRLQPGSLTMPLDFMADPVNESVAICGIRMVDDAGRTMTSAARFPTLPIVFGKMTGLGGRAGGLLPGHFMTPAELSVSRDVDQVIGAYYLIRRSVFERCAGFDERFFMYYEEVDLALRARRLGYRSHYLVETSAYHRMGGSSDAVKARRLFYSLRSRIQYFAKHGSAGRVGLIIFLTFTVELGARLFRCALRRSRCELVETLQAYALLVRRFPPILPRGRQP